MKASFATMVAGAATLAAAQMSMPNYNFTGNPFKKYELQAKGIKANFIPFGARLTDMWVSDRNGTMRDIVVGYDNATDYVSPRNYFGAVVGRYANRIKNGTFEVDGEDYDIPQNEKGHDTLHGGEVGYDMRNWTVVKHTNDSITFMLYDQAYQGFPGDVINLASYTLTDEPAWVSRMTSIPVDKTTPIMLANHVYWNIGAFVNQRATKILNDTLYMPYSKRFINIDGYEVPTGNISVTMDTPLDFTTPKQIGKDISDTENGCGTGCLGYDNAFILDRPRYSLPADPSLTVLEWSSPDSGIKMSLETNQQSLQLYTCDTQDGSVKAKKDQQNGSKSSNVTYDQFGCMVIETQDWIDGINNPSWGRQDWQLYSPTTEPYLNMQKYKFSTIKGSC